MSSNRLRGVLGSLLLAACLALPAPTAWSQLRTLPTNAKRAQLTGYQNPFVIISGETHRLAPGAVIFDTHNRTILPGYLPASADVVYTVDNTGSVMRIYLLTAQERERLDSIRR